MDLGTANTIIIKDDKIVLDEPSVVAFDNRTGEMIAVGTKAREMYEKGNANIRTIRPLREGVIADFDAAEHMIRGMIRMISRRRGWFTPSLRMVVCIPSGSTEVEIRAVRDSSEHAGGRDVYMIYEPMAAAIGVGIDVLAPEGHMIVDIGGGTTEIAVISLGGIVEDQSIDTAGDELTQDIMDHMRDKHQIKVGERTAEQIKIQVGAVYADIVANGVVLTGGGALLRGLDKRLSKRFGLDFKIAEDPLHSVALGTGIALKNIHNFNFLFR